MQMLGICVSHETRKVPLRRKDILMDGGERKKMAIEHETRKQMRGGGGLAGGGQWEEEDQHNRICMKMLQ